MVLELLIALACLIALAYLYAGWRIWQEAAALGAESRADVCPACGATKEPPA